MRMREFPEEARFSYSRFADDCYDLAAVAMHQLESVVQAADLLFTTDKSTEAPRRHHLHARAREARAGKFIDLNRLAETLDGNASDIADLDVALGEPEGL